MRSNEVAKLLRKWIESNQFKGWSDYMVEETIEELEMTNFSFDELTPKEQVSSRPMFAPHPTDYVPTEKEAVVESDETDNWLTF